MRPSILITSSAIIRSGDEWSPVVHGQSHTYTDAIIKAGGTPFIAPITDNPDVLRQLYDKAQGLLFSGGGDVDPTLYGAKPIGRIEKLVPVRDKQEIQLLKWAVADNKPVLGICRGMQIINVALGGTLYQDIAANVPDAQNHESSAHEKDFNHLAHRLRIEPDSKLRSILGVDEINTNALHHQAVNKLGENLIAVARAEDGIIEGIELANHKFVIAVQSHPESLESATEPVWYELFKSFVKAAV